MVKNPIKMCNYWMDFEYEIVYNEIAESIR